MIAISPNNEEVWIFKATGEDTKKWEKKYTLKEHGGYISSMDWCPSSNLLVTCGHDRNAYVWKLEEKSDVWKPTLVVLRINRAATSVKWSPTGNKFAVGSGAKCVPVCQFEASNDWWISKMIKKHKSTVLSLAWCCNNKFIVTGSCDNKCRIFSAYIEGLDSAEDDGFGEVWPKQHEFGECLAEFDAGSWVNSVAWAPNGFRLAYAGHASTVHFVQILAGSSPLIQNMSLKGLPFMDLRFLSDNTVLAVGFDNTPTIFNVQGGTESDPQWAFLDVCDKALDEKKTTAPSTGAAAKGAAFAAAKNLFHESTSKGIQISTVNAPKTKNSSAPATPALNTRHTNVVNCIWLPASDKVVTKFVTSGLDGRICFWDLNKLKMTVK